MSKVNPLAVLLIAFATVVGALCGAALLGLAAGLLIVLVASVI